MALVTPVTWALAGLAALVAIGPGCTFALDLEPLAPVEDVASADTPAADLPEAPGDGDLTPDGAAEVVAIIDAPGGGACTLHYAPGGIGACPRAACVASGWALTFDASRSVGLVGEEAVWAFWVDDEAYVVSPAEATGPTPTVRLQLEDLNPVTCFGATPAFEVTVHATLSVNGGADTAAAQVLVSGVANAACPQTACQPAPQ